VANGQGVKNVGSTLENDMNLMIDERWEVGRELCCIGSEGSKLCYIGRGRAREG
jgi:hypothetical protein